MPKISRALISVSDKTGIVWLARELDEMGVELISTGGTYKIISAEDIKVVPVAEVTEFPEMLDGRVKTLHPKVHGGILADRSKPDHMRQLEYQKITPIDMVVVNLYPFAETVAREGVTRDEAIEQIDIGGPTMVRAAAKNHAHVAVVVNPERYRQVIEEIKNNHGVVSEVTCRELAREAFAHTAEYDTMISGYLAEEEEVDGVEQDDFPSALSLSFHKVAELRYGENPHQIAALYREQRPSSGSLASAKQMAGGALSFNNILDGEAAWQCSLEFDEPACVIIKHNNPCGVAVDDNLAVAYTKAFDCDPVSAYGSVIAFNRKVDVATAKELADNFVELLLAPGYEPGSLEILTGGKVLRVLEMQTHEGPYYPGKDARRIHGGILVQDYDTDEYDVESWRCVTHDEPTDEQKCDLLFAWRVAKHVKSNAIVFAHNNATVGVGAGQMSRVDSVMIAAEKSKGRSAGAVLGSDAFFPFPDGVERAAAAGIRAIVQPGGSKNDDEVIATCDRHGIAMLFTGKRHFRH
jgi:phosphoribosylaminoimidazolecarboxamide formyltransferase/IMP cyclohydrolase